MIQPETLSIVVGTNACNCSCPYCVSKMTFSENKPEIEEVNWRNFSKALEFAKTSGVSTVLLTGKGEPTLYPQLITRYLKEIKKYKFPFVELQTNGVELVKNDIQIGQLLNDWWHLGLTTIGVSCVHFSWLKNKEIFGENYPDLPFLIQRLHEDKFMIRLCCMLLNGHICQVSDVNELLKFCLEHEVDQLTIRPIAVPDKSENEDIYRWTEEHKLQNGSWTNIQKHIETYGKLLLELGYGAKVFDMNGQNICLSNCLTEPIGERIRQLILHPNGRLNFSWQYKGAVLL